MKSMFEILEEVRRAAGALNDYHWENKGTLAELRELSKRPGVYLITDGIDDYIGRAIRKGGLERRIREHLAHPHNVWKSKENRRRFRVKVLEMTDDVRGELWAAIVEAVLIYTEKPSLNRNGKRHAVIESMKESSYTQKNRKIQHRGSGNPI